MNEDQHLPILPTGRGTGLTPANRFTGRQIEIDPSHLEYDDDAQRQQQRPQTRYFEDASQSVISENDSPDVPFRYSLNPYRGCLHGCSYCYARTSHEYLGLNAGLDFETTIFVKKNAAELFRTWLCRARYQPERVMMSGITDCYQPVERALKITRECLQVANEASQPISIITKNKLITRDIDLLSDLAKRQLCSVALSINSLDQSLTKLMEPDCSPPKSRLDAVRQLTSAGIPVHIMVSPVIPGLNDHEIPAVLKQAAEAGAQSAHYLILRLPLAVQEIFTDWLTNRCPNKLDVVLSRLRSVRNGELSSSKFGERMRGTGPMADQIQQLFQITARKYGLKNSIAPLRTDLFIPPRSPDGQLRLF